MNGISSPSTPSIQNIAYTITTTSPKTGSASQNYKAFESVEIDVQPINPHCTSFVALFHVGRAHLSFVRRRYRRSKRNCILWLSFVKSGGQAFCCRYGLFLAVMLLRSDGSNGRFWGSLGSR